MLGQKFAGKGTQPHGVDRGGEPANVWRDQMRSLQTLWHPDLVPGQLVGLDSQCVDSPKERIWAGQPTPKEYGLDSFKERIWAGQPQKNMGWIDPKEYGLDSSKEMGWTTHTKRIWAG